MAMSREISINVHPEFRRQTTSEEQRKPRILTRSSSLPNGPKLKLVMETLNPSGARKGQTSKAEHEQTTAERPRQGTNDTKRNQNYKFWKSSLPEDLYPKVEHLSEHGPCLKQNAREGTEQRRHFFAENPFVEDLEKVFEDQYTSATKRRPLKLGRRNTFSTGTSRDTHQSAPKIEKNSASGCNRNEAFFNVPIQVEFDGIKDGNYENEKDLIENKVGEKNNVHGEDQTTEPVSDTAELKNHNGIRIQVIDEPCAVSFDGIKDCDKVDTEQVLDEPNSDSNKDTAEEINEGKANTEQGQIIVNIKDDEQSQSASLPQEFTEVNESKNKLSTIQSILKKAEGLEKEVDAFTDNIKTKEYLTLEEVLTCCLIELDGIETNRDETIRLARKTAVQQLQKTLVRLEQKVSCKALQNNEEEEKDESSKRDHSLENEGKNSNENV